MNKDPNGYAKGIIWKPKYTRIVLVVTRSALLMLAKGIETIINDNDLELCKNNGVVPIPPKANVTEIK